VDQVGEQRDGVGEDEDCDLGGGGEPEDREADRNRAHAGARADDRAVDEPVRVTVLGGVVVVLVLVCVGGVVHQEGLVICSE
jgi:hypothetical protein